MQIVSGTSCIRGLKIGPANVTEVEVTAPPELAELNKGPILFIFRKRGF